MRTWRLSVASPSSASARHKRPPQRFGPSKAREKSVRTQITCVDARAVCVAGRDRISHRAMLPKYHHMTSRYARLTPAAVDHCVEVVREATEVLDSHPIFDAVDFIVSAREILEAELLLESKGADFDEGDLSAHSDWSLACIADAMQQASAMLRERGNTETAALLHGRELSALRMLAESPWCSPLVNYHDVFCTLLNDCRIRRDPVGVRYLACDVVHCLEYLKGANVLNGLRELGRLHFLLGNRERAVDIFMRLLRHEPSDVWTHNEIAFVFARDLPELARAAAGAPLRLSETQMHDASCRNCSAT